MMNDDDNDSISGKFDVTDACPDLIKDFVGYLRPLINPQTHSGQNHLLLQQHQSLYSGLSVKK